ncbi:unnamed protein product [Clonostachys rosea]|uniref:Uncharacterized protein n=1 Tax=Bionectria ochroleuca TaxID=29856 RepID=A0ABY6UGI1_BIOOC|nr:unnamed protein product [Clonostachys rosea]
MKLSFVFFLLATAPRVIAAIDRPFFVSLGLVKSRIPRFIANLDHPYVKEHQHAIEGLSDPMQCFCHPESQLQALLPPIPDDIFKKLNLNGYKWDHTTEILSGFLDCPLAVGALEELHVQVSASPGKHHQPPAKALSLFTQLFKEAANLKTLAWMDPGPEWDSHNATSALHKHLMGQKLHLPSVTTLVLGPSAEFFVPAAPNLQKINSAPDFAWLWSGFDQRFSSKENGPQRRLIRSLGSAKQLEDVSLGFSFFADSIVELVQAAPGVKSLTLGDLSNGRRLYDSAGRDNFEAILSQLANLERLTFLGLNHVYELGISSHPEPDIICGNAYLEPDGAKLGRTELAREIRETEEAADIILQSLPQLTKLCIRECAEVEAGKVVRWPWTGRLREYLLQSWPRHDGMDWEGDVKEDPDGPVLWTWEEDEKWLPTSKEHHMDEL